MMDETAPIINAQTSSVGLDPTLPPFGRPGASCQIVNSAGQTVTIRVIDYELGGGAGPAEAVLQPGESETVSCSPGTLQPAACTITLANPGETDCRASLGTDANGDSVFALIDEGYPLTMQETSPPGASPVVEIAALG